MNKIIFEELKYIIDDWCNTPSITLECIKKKQNPTKNIDIIIFIIIFEIEY